MIMFNKCFGLFECGLGDVQLAAKKPDGSHITNFGRGVSVLALAAVATLAMLNSGAATPPPGIVGAYSFNEGVGTTVADESGNGNSGSTPLPTHDRPANPSRPRRITAV
jgi:hypothetical protein